MIEGVLGAGGGADLLAALWAQERTGILELATGGVERKLVMAAGEIVYISSSEVSERLQVRLVTGGLVPRAAVVEASKSPDLRQALAARGSLPVEQHDRVLAELVAEVVGKVMPATGAKFSFAEKAELDFGGVLPANDMVPVFWRATRGLAADFVKGFLGNPSQRVTRTGGDDLVIALTDLTAEEGFVISRIDGYGSVDDLVRASPLGPEATHRLLVGLTCVGYVDVVGRPTVRLPRPTRVAVRRKPVAAKPAASAGSITSTAGTITSSHGALATEPAPGTLAAARALREKALNADHYAVLGVRRDAPEDDIRKVYYALARLYHPDRFGRDIDASEREVVEDLFARIGDAFAVLADEERRKEYDEKLKSGVLEAEKAERKVDRKDLARQSFEQGRALAGGADRNRGAKLLEHAIDLEPDNYEYRMALARVLAADSRTRKRAEQHLAEAIRIDSTKPEAYYQLGLLYKAAGVKSRAVEQFRKGLKWDEGHEGMRKALEELEGDGGRAGGLFGRKK